MNLSTHVTVEQLSAYLDNLLNADEMEILQVHFATCQLCNERLTDFRNIQLGLSSLSVHELPRDFRLPVPNVTKSVNQPRVSQPAITRWLSAAFLICGLAFAFIGIYGLAGTTVVSLDSITITPTNGNLTALAQNTTPTNTRTSSSVAPNTTVTITTTPVVPVATAEIKNTYPTATATVPGSLVVLLVGIALLGISIALFIRLKRLSKYRK